jgi:hypothetical protein
MPSRPPGPRFLPGDLAQWLTGNKLCTCAFRITPAAIRCSNEGDSTAVSQMALRRRFTKSAANRRHEKKNAYFCFSTSSRCSQTNTMSSLWFET